MKVNQKHNLRSGGRRGPRVGGGIKSNPQRDGKQKVFCDLPSVPHSSRELVDSSRCNSASSRLGGHNLTPSFSIRPETNVLFCDGGCAGLTAAPAAARNAAMTSLVEPARAGTTAALTLANRTDSAEPSGVKVRHTLGSKQAGPYRASDGRQGLLNPSSRGRRAALRDHSSI